MVSFKAVLAFKSGKCVQKEINEPEAKKLVGKKIGDTIKGDSIGLAGYEFELTGGSDDAGFPMRRDVQGTGRKRILIVSGVGVKKGRKGMKQRKTVAGNTVFTSTVQVNLKVLKEGSEKLGGSKEEKAADSKKEDKQEKPKAPKQAEVKEEAKEEKKEAPKEESKEEKKEAPAEENAKDKAQEEEAPEEKQ